MGKGIAPPLLKPFVSAASEPSKPKSAILVYNPVGGKKKALKLAETIVLPMLEAAGIQVERQPTLHAGHAQELGKTLSLEGIDALIVMGGDGTLSDLLNGFLSREDKAADQGSCRLGFIPAGTGNTYLREVLGTKTAAGCESGVRAAVQAIIDGRSRRVDCQQLDMQRTPDGEPMSMVSINTVMAGFGPTATAVAERRRWLGPMRYDISIKTEIVKLPCRKPLPSKLTIDDGKVEELEDLFLFSSFVNKHTGTHHRLAPYAQLDDGKLDACYTNKPLRSVAFAAKIDGLIKSGGKHVHEPICSIKQCTKMKLETEKPAQLMVDGDLVGFTPLTVTVRPGAFALFTPVDPTGS